MHGQWSHMSNSLYTSLLLTGVIISPFKKITNTTLVLVFTPWNALPQQCQTNSIESAWTAIQRSLKTQQHKSNVQEIQVTMCAYMKNVQYSSVPQLAYSSSSLSNTYTLQSIIPMNCKEVIPAESPMPMVASKLTIEQTH